MREREGVKERGGGSKAERGNEGEREGEGEGVRERERGAEAEERGQGMHTSAERHQGSERNACLVQCHMYIFHFKRQSLEITQHSLLTQLPVHRVISSDIHQANCNKNMHTICPVCMLTVACNMQFPGSCICNLRTLLNNREQYHFQPKKLYIKSPFTSKSFSFPA